MKKILFTGILLFSLLLAHAQVSLQASADKSNYAIGDYIYVTLTLDGKSGMQFNWPGDRDLTAFELINANPLDTIENADQRTYHKKLIISIYEAGTHYFPQVTIPYRIPNDTAVYTITSDSFPIVIDSIAVDTTLAIKPITDVMMAKESNWLWLQILIGAILFIILGFTIWYFFIRKENKVAIKKEEPVLPLYDRTIQALRDLESRKLWQQHQLKEYYSALTDILRNYLEERFNMHAMESTTEEIISQISRHPETRTMVNELQFVGELADMAKFARSKPLPDENMRAMQLVIQFVEHTKPQPVTTEKPVA